MSGSIAMTAMAAIEGGAGLVRLAVPEPILETVAQFAPEYTLVPLPADSHGRLSEETLEVVPELAEEASVVAIGPGIGRSESLDRVMVHLYENLDAPMVIDADGLNALAAAYDFSKKPKVSALRVLTPHPGEFSRLTDDSCPVETEGRRQAAEAFAKKSGALVVLKGSRTVVTNIDQTAVNTTGNPGMATGGTGDVLTGLIAAMIAQGYGSFEAARLSVFLHGLAGDCTWLDRGFESVTAGKVIEHLNEAFRILRTVQQREK
jgi:NAD(P)H-hydrate epimerase